MSSAGLRRAVHASVSPTFSAGGVDLYLGDSAEIIPTFVTVRGVSEFDLLCTDPPYGMELRSFGRAKEFAPIIGDKMEDRPRVVEIMRMSVGKLRKHRHVYSFGPAEILAQIETLTARTTLIWDKVGIGVGNLSLPWGPGHEPINFAANVRSVVDRENGYCQLSARLRKGSVIRCQRPNGRGVNRHSTEKPVSLMRQLIESSTSIGEVVFDPFMGCGSTVIAALLSGRRAVGIEMDPGYFKIACDRVKAVLPLLGQLERA